jgi:hypothetical protein
VARWVPQDEVRSLSPSGITRLRYLEPLVQAVDQAVTLYLHAHPDGEAVTVHVLASLGVERLEASRGGRTLDTVKQDIGRLVPVRLVEMFGEANVFTYREDVGSRPSTRPAPKGTPTWIRSFTPHKIRQRTSAVRIVLDTNVVRDALYQAAPVEFLERLTELHGEHPVSVADPAWAELVRSFHKNPNQLAAWRHVSGVLDALLDPQLPIVPSGRRAAAIAGLLGMESYNREEASRHYRLVWRFTAEARRVEDFAKRARVVDAQGRATDIGPLDPVILHAEFERRVAAFKRFTERTLTALSMPFDEACAFVKDGLLTDMPEAAVERMDLYVRAVVQYGEDLRRPKQPHKATDNDAIDLNILFCALLPAWICTNDDALRSLVLRSGSADAPRVMTPAELLRRLEAERDGST